MTEQEQELYRKVQALEKENTYLHQQIKEQRYGLTWIDVPEAFDAESVNKIPVLEEVPDKSFTDNSEKPTHILIEGDNYHALTCLNYTHKGKVDVIYIDPPYNLDKDDFVYNDSRFLEEYPDGKPISKDDPLRHSSWLSFMEKRLVLSKNLLSDKGVVFISIDDNEQANLRLLCNNVFGESNFIGQLIVKTATDNNATQINIEHEYMICYAKSKIKQSNWERTNYYAYRILKKYRELARQFSDINDIEKELRLWIKQNKNELPQVAHYNNVDERGVFSSSSNSSNPHPGGYIYDVFHPITGLPVPKPANGWRWPLSTFNEYEKHGEILWGKDHTTQPHVKKRIETAKEYLRSLIYEDNRGNTKQLSDIFNGIKIFNNPKSVNIISSLIDYVSSKESIILDFFAGSGTTMHAVAQLNTLDGGRRQCILVQIPETTWKISNGRKNFKKGCEAAFNAGYKTITEITYERNRRVMQGYTNASGEQVAGLGGSLKYYKTAFVNGGRNDHNSIQRPLDADKVALAMNAGTLISLAENTLYRQEEPNEYYEIFTDKQGKYAAVYKQEDYARFDEFENKVKSLHGNVVVYTFSWANTPDAATNFLEFPNVEVKAFPNAIIDSYNKALKQIENNK